jgi:hypothetical protein
MIKLEIVKLLLQEKQWIYQVYNQNNRVQMNNKVKDHLLIKLVD